MREMFVDNNVILLRQPDMTMEGHNNPPGFDDDIAAVLARGTLYVAWDQVKVAIHDPRLDRPHLAVLVELLDCLNSKTGTAWPSRELLAMRCRVAVKTVQNVLYDLKKHGYISWEKRPVDGRRLTQYVVPLAHIDRDQLRAQLDEYLAKLPARQGNETARHSGQKVTRPSGHTRQDGQKSAPHSRQKTASHSGQQEGTKEPTKEKKVRVASPTAQPRGSRLPENWILPKAWGVWALEQFDVSPDQIRKQAQTFKDYWLSKAGKQAVKIDWFATWRLWCGSDYTKWRRRKPMTSKIAPDLLDGVQAPQDDAYVQELRALKAARLARDAEDV
jgi:hypothetical protein